MVGKSAAPIQPQRLARCHERRSVSARLASLSPAPTPLDQCDGSRLLRIVNQDEQYLFQLSLICHET